MPFSGGLSPQERGRANQKAGKSGEGVAEHVMRSLGIKLVEKIATPKICLSGGRVRYTAKVSGDRRGVLPPNGRSVHAEVKTYKSKNLPYSAVKPHQREWLTRHAEIGGLSLLIWVSTFDIYVIEWGVDGIEGYTTPRSSITPEMAARLNVDKLG